VLLRSARPLWWCAAGGALAGGLFVLAASSDSAVAELLTRPWWNDRWRLAALAVLVLTPVAAHGAERVARALSGIAARTRTLAPAVLTVLALLGAGVYAGSNSGHVAGAYRTDQHLDAAEVAAMAWLADRVPPGEPVMNDPGDGSAYMAALEGLRPVFGHQVPPAAYAALEPARRTLLDRFRCLDTDDRVRRVVDDLGIRYVFLGTGFVRPGMGRVRGLQGLSASPSLTLVHTDRGVRVYRVERPAVPAARPLEGCPAVQDRPPG
jgi:hypothetical protein